jgi:hypothetical protein
VRIVENENCFELHIFSSITDNNVSVNGKCYNYKRLVIPNVLMEYFREKKSVLEYVYLYFQDDSIFLSVEKLHDIKYSKRRIIQVGKKNSFFINLNERSLLKHDVTVGSNVLFVVGGESKLNDSECISIELRFCVEE